VDKVRQPGDPDRSGPSRLLPFRPALAAALSAPGCRAVYAVTFGLDGNALAAADGNGRIYRWDMASGKLTRPCVPRRSGGLNDAAFGLGGDLLAAADGNGSTYVWRMSPPAT
jgi:hypothetical protein